jgi:tetratricopeptide (TPR) repeat protein
MAPEIIRGAPGDVRSDVYAFGLILYQMVSGDPFPPLTGVWAGDPWSFAEENLELQRTQKVPRLGSPIIPAIDRCLAYEPSDRFASFEEVQSYLTTIVGGRPRKAVLRTMPNANGAPSTASLSIDQAISLYRLGKLEEALASIRDVRSRQGGDASVWNTEGVILSDLGQCEEALQCFDRSIGHDSHWESSWSNKGRTLRMMRRFVDAIACYDTAIRLNPGAMPPWCSKGNCLFDLGRYPDAIECYDRAIDIDPHWWDAWAGRGKALVPLGRPGEAAWCLERALEVEPDETDVRRRYDELMARICSEAGPGVDRDSLLDRAAKHHEKGQLDQGLVCMHLIRVLSGADEVVFNNEGVFLSDLGRHREALRCFERAIEVNPSYANLWCNKGRTLRAMGRNLEALECYDRAIACAPDEATLWGNKGNCLRDLHRGDEALRCYERALALRPDDGQIRRDYDELRQTRRQR